MAEGGSGWLGVAGGGSRWLGVAGRAESERAEMKFLENGLRKNFSVNRFPKFC